MGPLNIPRLIIRQHIKEKLAGKKPPVTPEEATKIFELYFEDEAEEHPDDPNDPSPEGADPRYIIQVEHEGEQWRLAFALISRTEAVLLTCFRQRKRKLFFFGGKR